MSWENSETKNKHIGNLLAEATDKEMHEIFEQYMHKQNVDKAFCVKYIGEIIDAKNFDYYGEIRIVEKDEYGR